MYHLQKMSDCLYLVHIKFSASNIIICLSIVIFSQGFYFKLLESSHTYSFHFCSLCALTDCVPDPSSLNENTAMASLVIKLKKTLSEALPPSPRKPPPNYDLVHSKVTLQALGLTLGDQILVGGVKVNFISLIVLW